MSVVQIARRNHLSCRQVQFGIARARKREEERLQSSLLRDSRKRDKLYKRNQGKITPTSLARQVWEDPQRLPRLVPLFPIDAFTPGSACPHHGPIRTGSVFCCMVCSRSGLDGHPALERDPLTDPRPEPKAPAAARAGAVRETRKERRRRLREARESSSLTLSQSRS
jgi:hypothetical protein